MNPMNRRDFVRTAALGAASAAVSRLALAQDSELQTIFAEIQGDLELGSGLRFCDSQLIGKKTIEESQSRRPDPILCILAEGESA